MKLDKDTLHKVIEKRTGKALYLTRKMNQIPLDSVLIKLCDRMDNVNDCRPRTRFAHEYAAETRWIMENIDRTRLERMHTQVIENIVSRLQQM